jgi:hypothetical protein
MTTLILFLFQTIVNIKLILVFIFNAANTYRTVGINILCLSFIFYIAI